MTRATNWKAYDSLEAMERYRAPLRFPSDALPRTPRQP